MGNLAYVPPATAPLSDAGFATLTATAPDADAIRVVLARKDNGLRAVPPVKDALLSHYKETGFKPVWLKDGKPDARAVELLATLSRAGTEGLDPLDYLPAGLPAYDKLSALDGADAQTLALFDVSLSAQSLKYATHLSAGRFEPKRLSRYNDISPEPVSPSVALKILAWTPFPDHYLKGLVPSHPLYAALKAELATLAAAMPEAKEPFPDGKRIKTGQKDARVILLRARMKDMGFLPANEADVALEATEVLDKNLSNALKRFQKQAKVKQSGSLDQATVVALNTDQTDVNRNRLIYNMERLRWLPRDLGSRHVFVNQAAFEVRVMDKGQEAWRSKVIVGRPMTQTAVFHDSMETVVFNPSWGVPASIIVNEYLPKLRRDPGYLDRIGFKVVNHKGKVVSSRAVNWSAVGRNSQIGIHQPPGRSNALGELKFLFPNSHDIYMHDTPNRNLFSEEVRAFSHGCVRVENPRDFATVVLGWNREKVDTNVESGNSQSVKLDAPLPVHITYFTAWTGDDGKIRYFDDIYGRDEAMRRAMDETRRLRELQAATKLVEN
jgi:murein L,D-transpeptidase YcbB/YkuD